MEKKEKPKAVVLQVQDITVTMTKKTVKKDG
jgi:hypothetical protein